MWVNLFDWLAEQTATVTLRGGRDGEVTDSVPMPKPIVETPVSVDPDLGDVVLLHEALSEPHSAEDYGTHSRITNGLDSEDNPSWQGRFFAFWPDNSNLLMGKLLRVRGFFTGNSTGGSGNVKGAGSIGFIFKDDTDYYIENVLGGFGDFHSWPDANNVSYIPSPGVPSDWITLSEIELGLLTPSSPSATFIGLGHMGIEPDAGPPSWDQFGVEWQIWLDSDDSGGGPDESVQSWWMCKPKPTPTPCPVRPQGFVPFNEYLSLIHI